MTANEYQQLALRMAGTNEDGDLMVNIAADKRPGYATAEACRAEIYITESERSACRAGLEAARERMGNR